MIYQVIKSQTADGMQSEKIIPNTMRKIGHYGDFYMYTYIDIVFLTL